MFLENILHENELGPLFVRFNEFVYNREQKTSRYSYFLKNIQIRSGLRKRAGKIMSTTIHRRLSQPPGYEETTRILKDHTGYKKPPEYEKKTPGYVCRDHQDMSRMDINWVLTRLPLAKCTMIFHKLVRIDFESF